MSNYTSETRKLLDDFLDDFLDVANILASEFSMSGKGEQAVFWSEVRDEIQHLLYERSEE